MQPRLAGAAVLTTVWKGSIDSDQHMLGQGCQQQGMAVLTSTHDKGM
jgi:hypothetical protein